AAVLHVEKARRAGCLVVPEARVVRLIEGAEGRIAALEFRRPDGVLHKVRARIFVLAANALETPRLLMHSGLCRNSRALGRFLMDHLLVHCSFRAPEPVYAGRGPQTTSLVDYGRDGAFRRRYAAAKIFLSNALDVQGEAVRLLANPAQWPVLKEKLREYAKFHAMFGAEIEVLPDPDNRLMLVADERDAFGMPKLRARFQPGDYSERGVRHWLDQMQSWVEAMGGKIKGTRVQMSSHHPAGTCRMGTKPEDSVVTRDLRCHEHPNLYIVGSAVFPTIGTANPTLTIAALALRLAEKLARE
ncbi:MAG: GMC family oxidoreductase, partial [Zetaproteobacteria bacterium]